MCLKLSRYISPDARTLKKSTTAALFERGTLLTRSICVAQPSEAENITSAALKRSGRAIITGRYLVESEITLARG